jgi:T1SS-143 domain-containing protein
MAKPTSGNVSVNLDQWADGSVLQGDFDGTGQSQEVFVNGNLNAQKAHYNEGDAIPYRAVLDNMQTGVTYGLVIQWDTVDSGAYALDYLTGYNFSFDGTKHPGEPDVDPLQGVNGISSGASTLAAILADPQLLLGFGSQFGVTDGIDAGGGLPSGAQSITIFGAVTNATVSLTSYNADKTKASVTITFTYTGSSADNADTVVVAWGGHIASSLDWADDAGETVETASDISGSPYHMRVQSLVVDGVVTSVGNQDRSLSADAVLPPEPPPSVSVDLIADDDDTLNGIGDSADGDDAASVPAITPLNVTGATSVDFNDLHLDPVLNTSAAAVKSGGVALFYFWDAAASTLYASTDVTSATTAAATVVFSIALQESGGLFDYFFSSTGQIDHPAGNTENNVLVDVTFTATGLGGSATGTFHLSFDDDLPVRASNPTPVTATVEEDGMSSAVTPEAGGLDGDDQSLGNPGAGDTLADDQASGLSGSLSALVDAGADQPPTMSLSSVTTGLPTLFSKGVAVTYAVTDSGDADLLLDTLTATAGARTVFTLKVNPDGSWAFDLDDQLDHVAGGGENTALRTAADGSTSVGSIDFSSMLQVTDFDGDTVAPLLAGDFAITVEDDIPVRAANPQSVTATVEEDGMSSAVIPEAGGLNGNDQSLGNPGAGDTLADDQASGAVGSLTALMSVGADEPPTISLSSVTTSLPALFSKGDAVSYAVIDSGDADTLLDTLTATAGARTVFTLKVNPDGSWAFDLDDQLDHVAGGGENTALRTAADGSTSAASIDFSAIVQVTDFDGDTVAPLQSGDFAITVQDDVPVRAANPQAVTATVEEDGMSSAVTPEAGGLNGDDQSLGNPGAGDTLADDQASGTVGSLTALMSVGADEPPTISLSSVTTSLPTLFSKGVAVAYAVTDSGDADTLLDTLTATAGARTVFTLKVNPDGSWAFDLDDQLDHVAGGGENTALRTNLAGTTSAASIDFSSIVQVTDFDGDTVAPLLAGDFAITVQDDVPVRAANPQSVTATVEEDGMSSAVTPEAGGLNGNDQSLGNPGAGDTLADDQASGAIGSLTALMSVGADEPPTITLSSVTTSLPTLFSKGDAVTYAVTDSADADTLLDTLTATAGGRTVFTLQVNPDGSWAFDLDDQLDHVDDDLNTENTALRTNLAGTTSVASIDFSAIVQVTDFDGDTVAPLLAGDFAVTVEDDIPVFNSITNVVAFNTGDPMTGMYSASVGADEPGDIVLLTLAGTAPSGRAIFNVVLNQDSSTVTSFSFDYFTKEAPSTDTLTATGTVTFNANGTYVVDLDGPILGGTTFSTSGGTNLDYDTTGNNSPEITVKAYTSDFFGVLTGQSSVPLSDTTDLVTDDSDHSFAAGDTFKSVGTAYVNVSTDTVGVNSDTVQNGELLNYDFYTANPVSPASPSGPPPVSTPTAVIVASTEKAFVDTVDITLNQINVGKEDIAILLKLFNADTDDFTTKLLLANASSDYQAIAGSTDVKVSVTEDDYQDGYRIYGMQILTSTEDITGTGFSLSDGSVVNLTSSGNDLADTSDGDVMKIIRIEVTANLPGDSDLAFTGKMVDEDGDETSNFGFSVHLEGDSEVLTGGAGSDYLNGTAAADTMSGGAGADFMFGGAGADVFQFASGDSGITLGTADTILDFLTGVDKIATSKAAGNATIAAGAGLADLAAFFGAADAVLTAGAGTNDVYVAYDAAGSGNAWAVVDENDTGSVDAGDTLIVLAGINAAAEIAATDFI